MVKFSHILPWNTIISKMDFGRKPKRRIVKSKGLNATFIDYIEDVTPLVLAGVDAEKTLKIVKNS